MAEKIRIGVYNGFGVDPHCFTETQLWIENILRQSVPGAEEEGLFEIVNRSPSDDYKRCQGYGLQVDDLYNTDLINSLDVMIMPGGNVIEYIAGIEKFPIEMQIPENSDTIQAHINELKNKGGQEFSQAQINIRNFVNNGGLISGTCAGAYYLSECMKYSKTSDITKDQWDRHIDDVSKTLLYMSPSTPTGHPSKDMGNFPSDHEFANKPIVFTEAIINYLDEKGIIKEAQIPLLSGPYFEKYDGKRAISMGRYAVGKDQGTPHIYAGRPCLIKNNWGKGRIIALGVHPEFRPKTTDTLRKKYKINHGSRVINDVRCDPELYEKICAQKQDLMDRFSRAVVLNELVHMVSYLQFHKYKPKTLISLTDRGFNQKFSLEKEHTLENNKDYKSSELSKEPEKIAIPKDPETKLKETNKQADNLIQSNENKKITENSQNSEPSKPAQPKPKQEQPKSQPLLYPKPTQQPPM